MSYKFKGQKVIINGEEQIIVPGNIPVSPSQGQYVIDSEDFKLKVWNGSRWMVLGDASDIVFDNLTNGFTSITVQSAIEEIKTSLISLSRFSIITTFNGTIGNNQWLGYSELIPGNTTPIVIPRKCKLREITYSWTSTLSLVGGLITITANVDGRFDLYKNGTASGDIVHQKTFTNSGAGGMSTGLNIPFNAGDIIIGRWIDTGDNPSDAAICYFFEPIP